MSDPNPIAAPAPRAPSLLPFLLAGFVAFLAFASLLWWQQSGQGTLFFYPADDSYLDLAAARGWAEVGQPVIGTDAIPLQVNALWRALISIVIKYGMDLPGSPVLLSLIAGLLTIPALLSLSRVVAVRAALMWWAIIAWALISSIIPDAFTGQPLALGTLLVMLALFAHAYGLRSDDTPFPIAAALWLALAALFRIEYAALWLACGFHVLILRLLGRVTTGYFTLLIRWLGGVVIFAIVLCPVIWWNMRAIEVPWPVAPDAILTINAVDRPGTIHSFAVLGLHASFRALWNGPLLGNGFLKLFALAGGALVLLDILRKRLDWASTTLLFGFLVPFAFTPFYPFVGASGLDALTHALTPLWLLLIGYTVVAVVRLVERILDKARLPLPRALLSGVAAILIGIMPVLAGIRDQAANWREHRKAQHEMTELRTTLANQMDAKVTKESALASDMPGWLLFEGYESVLDLHGRLQPVILNYATASGILDAAGLRNYLALRGVQFGVLQSGQTSIFGSLFDCASGDPGPVVCEFSWRAAP